MHIKIKLKNKKNMKYIILSLFVQISIVTSKISYDAEFWEGFNDNLAPYEHNWKNIPDFIDEELV